MSAIDCKNVDDKLIDYLYDELDASEEREIEAHIEGCARCQAEVAAYRRVRKAARAMPVEEPSSALMAGLMEAASAQLAGGGATAAAAVSGPPHLSIVPPLAPETSTAASAPASTHAARAPRGPRAWYRHPAFAVAASAVLVAGTATYFATSQPDLVSPAPVVATAQPPSPSAPAAAPVAVAHGETTAVERKAAEAAAAEGARVPVAAEPARPAPRAAPNEAPALALDDSTGSSAFAARHAGRPSLIPEAAPPAALRPPSGQGHWLDKDENAQLANSIKSQGGAVAAASPVPPAPPPSAEMNAALAQRQDRQTPQPSARLAAPSQNAPELARADEQFDKKEQQGAGALDQAPRSAAPAGQPAASELQTLLARFNADTVNKHCTGAVKAWDEIRRTYPDHAFTVDERRREGQCLYTVGRNDEARVVLREVVNDLAPMQKAHVESILRKIDSSQGIDSNGPHGSMMAAPASAPEEAAAAHVASKRAKSAAPPAAGKKAASKHEAAAPADALQ